MNEKCLYCRRRAIGCYRATYDDGTQVEFMYCREHRAFTRQHLRAKQKEERDYHRSMQITQFDETSEVIK